MVEIREYIDSRGRRPFRRWVNGLDPVAGRRVENALHQLAGGNLARLKSVGGGVLEYRLHFGPGYRVYLGRDGLALVVLLAGGTKARRQQDIEMAREFWRDYGCRKREEV